jgi:type I restriction enzyme S subunit
MRQRWEMKSLGEIGEILNGGTPDTTVPKFWEGENLWITPKDMGKLESIYVDDTLRKITDAGLKNSSAKILPPNSIILSSRAPIGHLAVNTKPISTNQGCKGLIPKKGIDTLYLYYFLLKSVDLLNSLGTGATFKELSGSKLGTVQIPVPPLPEQQRIVAILDEAFASIAKAKANAELTLKNAKELFESYLQGVFENEGEGWEETSLKNEIHLLVGFAFKSKEYTTKEDDILLLRGDNIMQGTLRWDDVKRWKKSAYEDFNKYQLQENDIVLAMDRPWVKAGLKIARLSKNDLPALLVQRTACLRTKSKLNNSFLFHLLKSKGFMNYLIDVQSGIGVPHISGQQILDFEFNRPPLKTQHSIVKKLDALSTKTKKLEAIYQQKINDLQELKKSILQKAFSGELKTVTALV